MECLQAGTIFIRTRLSAGTPPSFRQLGLTGPVEPAQCRV